MDIESIMINIKYIGINMLILIQISISLTLTVSVFAHPGNTALEGYHYCRTNCSSCGV